MLSVSSLLNLERSKKPETLRLARVLKVVSFFLFIIMLFPGGVESEIINEFSIKVGFLLNFAKYTDTHTNNETPSVIRFCAFDHNPFGDAFKMLNGKKIGFKIAETRIVHDQSALEECQVLYLEPAQLKTLAHMFPRFRAKRVLTVSESTEKTVLAFDLIDNHIRFRCNLKEAAQSGIKLSSQLVKIARTVIDYDGNELERLDE
jgi:YfiR/HmsC-like